LNQTILVAIVSFCSAIVGGAMSAIVAPYVRFHLDERKRRDEQRRAQIKRWRSMLIEISDKLRSDGGDLRFMLQHHPEYITLEPHLPDELKQAAYTRSFYVKMGTFLPLPLESYKHEIAAIEARWNLV
jgi:hypothetical protein